MDHRAIWRGYKEIKDAGGWVSLAFSGSGIYRFCKYRVGFGKAFSTKLGRLQSSLEVAADTVHPEWRKLLQIIGQESPTIYHGHPHDWVVSENAKPVPLASTYRQWYPDFQFRQLQESELDEAVWGIEDPRRVSGTVFCGECGYLQSAIVATNECRCFPEIYGGCKAPSPIQVFRAATGKNNGLVARCVRLLPKTHFARH
jgi:ATP-dependent RNA helicase DDX49/DBP8